MQENVPRRVLPLIIFSQFAGTSLWFAGNAILRDLPLFLKHPELLGDLTTAVQVGFIIGTLLFAITLLADRFRPRKIFFICCVLGALSNLGIVFFESQYSLLLLSRFATGLFMAGIYPIGMKIAASWYTRSLGNSLSYLVAALTLGTAFPHILKYLTFLPSMHIVVYFLSFVAMLGGFIMLLGAPCGPNLKRAVKFSRQSFIQVLKNKKLHITALGYFGHQWEIYAFWVFVPSFIDFKQRASGEIFYDVSLWSFLIIASGTVGCIVGGQISKKVGGQKVARLMMLASGALCFLSPYIFTLHWVIFLALIVIWSALVSGDSPQHSALNVSVASPEFIGTSLTIVTSIGFIITIFSIQLLRYLTTVVPYQYIFVILGPGPLFGYYILKKLGR